MKIIQLPVRRETSTQKVDGTFTFLNASELIYQLECVLEQMEAADTSERIRIAFDIKFLDVYCEEIIVEYIHQFNHAIDAKSLCETTIEWKCSGTDIRNMEFGHLLNTMSDIDFIFTDNDIDQ